MARKRSKDANAKPGDGTTLKGVQRALDVLEYVAIHPGRAIDISEGMGLSWATLHRTLSQLEQGEFLERDDETNEYQIGRRLWLIGATYIANQKLLERAQPYLREAEKLSGVTVQLVERIGKQAVNLYSSQTGEDITKATYGYHFPLHTGSKGQVLLAFADEEFIDDYLGGALEKLTANSITDPDKLREIIGGIRQNGYAVTIADVQPFTASMSAPIFDRSKRIIGCLSFVTRKSTMEREERREQLFESLLQIAQSISIALGWRPGT